MKWLSLVLLVGMASAQHCPKIEIDKSSGFCTVPDPALTPGEMDSSLACVSNNDRPRNVTDTEKDAILRAYGYPASATLEQMMSLMGRVDSEYACALLESQFPSHLSRYA